MASSTVQHMYFSTIEQVGEIARMTTWKQGKEEMTMWYPKIPVSFVTVCPLFSCGICHAKVYDLGDISKDKSVFSLPSTFYTHSAVDGEDSDRVAFSQTSSYSYSFEVEVTSKCSKRLDLPVAFNGESANDTYYSGLCEKGHAGQQENSSEDSARFTPKDSKIESFAMVLSGLGLLGLSIRRRKSDAFE